MSSRRSFVGGIAPGGAFRGPRPGAPFAMLRVMALASKEALVAAVKQIVALAKNGEPDKAFEGYRSLFSDADFANLNPEDQRQALRLMVLSKSAPDPAQASSPAKEAHSAARDALARLVELHREPADFEMLGVCHVMLGNEDAAGKVWREGLAIERERSPGSDLCGQLMKRISLI